MKMMNLKEDLHYRKIDHSQIMKIINQEQMKTNNKCLTKIKKRNRNKCGMRN
jgi:hypothetical protein